MSSPFLLPSPHSSPASSSSTSSSKPGSWQGTGWFPCSMRSGILTLYHVGSIPLILLTRRTSWDCRTLQTQTSHCYTKNKHHPRLFPALLPNIQKQLTRHWMSALLYRWSPYSKNGLLWNIHKYIKGVFIFSLELLLVLWKYFCTVHLGPYINSNASDSSS